MYKSQLQEYAQKAGLVPPVYEHVKEGASHEPRFKSNVWVNGQTYSSAPGYPNLRSAEHAAAKVALDSLLQNAQMSGVVPSPVHESGLCKNLLQEFAQKNGYPLPNYKIMRQGGDHSPIFTSTVEIAGVNYSGGGAKNKKEAEIKAARTALLAIQASRPAAAAVLPAIEPYRPVPLEVQPGQVANFVKSHAKRKKRGRAHQQIVEEPLAARMKRPVGQSPLANQVTQVPQVSQVLQVHAPYVPQFVTHVAQSPQVGLVGAHGQSAMSMVNTKLDSGASIGTSIISNEPVERHLVDVVMEDTPQLKTEVKESVSVVQGTVEKTEPSFLDSQVITAREHITPIVVQTDSQAHERTVKIEADTVQEVTAKTDAVPVHEVTVKTEVVRDSQVTTVKTEVEATPVPAGILQTTLATETLETSEMTEVYDPATLASQTHEVVNTVEVREETSVFQVDRGSVPIPGITVTPSRPDTPQNIVDTENVVPVVDGELQPALLQAMTAGPKQVTSEAV